ncbi:MAG: Gfo/Idh/MocA family oxidoreductase [Bacteroidales bacterium]|nr:Gfo/Idh/MocA family oxidoreductase [Bacteroidales bacterium]
MLNIGLLGADLIGKQHAQAIHEVNGLRVCGVFDPDTRNGKEIAKELNIPFFNNPLDLIERSDALDITTATDFLFSLVPGFLKASRHLLLPPEILKSKVLGDHLLKLSQEAKAKIQIGYTDRFHSVLLSSIPFIENPLFIDAQHYIPFTAGIKSEAELEMIMTRNIDIIYSIVKANIKRIHATGVNVFGSKTDIVNAHLEFDNGTNVNLTINLVAQEYVHRFQFFKTNTKVECDFGNQSSKVVEIKNGELTSRTLNTPPNYPLKEAFNSFYQSIIYNSDPVIGISEGCQAKDLAQRLLEKIKIISQNG